MWFYAGRCCQPKLPNVNLAMMKAQAAAAQQESSKVEET
jgi:hypothetical protein